MGWNLGSVLLLSFKVGDGMEILKSESPEECSVCGDVKSVYLCNRQIMPI